MTMSPDDAGLLLPVGARLVHIGPPKTGTTSLQAAFHSARPKLEAEGVHYAGRSQHSMSAALAIVGRATPFDPEPPPIWKWRALAREVRGSRQQRVVLSSESLSFAKPDVVRRIVEDLGGSRVHVAVTLRALSRVLPSHWQQRVQKGFGEPFDRWLTAIVGPDTSSRSKRHRYRHDLLVARWAEVVGPQRLTVVVVNEQDPSSVLRAFERLLGLPVGLLVLDRPVNRSLTLGEIEALRALNDEFRARGLSPGLHARVVQRGAALLLKDRTPDPAEPRLALPSWAAEGAASLGREVADGVRAAGVRVVGDLDALSQLPKVGSGAGQDGRVTVPPDVAATLAMGVLLASGAARNDGRGARALARRIYWGAAATWDFARSRIG